MTQTQTETDRPDRYPPETDPTRPEVVDGRRRVVKHFTRFRRVGSGLGTNPTRTDPWTALVERHHSDRVLRQFGLAQQRPDDVVYDDRLHKIDLRGKFEKNWREEHGPYIIS